MLIGDDKAAYQAVLRERARADLLRQQRDARAAYWQRKGHKYAGL